MTNDPIQLSNPNEPIQHQLTPNDLQVLDLVGDVLIQINAISDRKVADGLTDKQRLELICNISKVSHPFPAALVERVANPDKHVTTEQILQLQNTLKNDDFLLKAQYQNLKDRVTLFAFLIVPLFCLGVIVAATAAPGEEVMSTQLYDYIQAALYIVFMSGWGYCLYKTLTEYKLLKKLGLTLNSLKTTHTILGK